MNQITCSAAAIFLALASVTSAQLSLPGSGLALQSDGTPDGKLDRNGYVGTFIQVDADKDVTIEARVTGTSTDQTLPNATLAIADDEARSKVVAGGAGLRITTHLPAGTYVLRLQLDNAPLAGAKSLSVDSITLAGATFANDNTDANALAAADTYIEHFRKGDVKVHLDGMTPGTSVHLKLKRHAFNFGAAVSGFEKAVHMDPAVPAGSDSERYQQALRDTFSLIVPSNAGKWAYNEKERGTPTMDYIDRLRDFAKTNDQRMRMHTMLWDTEQQPLFVRDLLTKAAAGDVSAKADLRKAISARIQYYIRDRAPSYVEMDILNEAYHQPRYWRVFGADGIADIFKEADAAVKAAGANTLLCVNEYNILQWSQTPPYGSGAKGDPDPYANWYREHVEQIRDAGGPVTCIGVQYYADVRPDLPQPHSAARINQVFQNLRVTGLPISLTEFGVNALPKRPTPPTTQQSNAAIEKSAQVIDEAMRVSFGMPGVTSFISWGFWSGDVWEQAPLGTLFDAHWKLTPAGRARQALLSKWDTDTQATIDAKGDVAFRGFYGDYELTVDGRTVHFTCERGKPITLSK